MIITLVTSISVFMFPSLYEILILNPWELIKKKKIYTVITSGLIHANITHLLFNMITFFFFAFYLEALIGHIKFLILYLTSLILSDVSTIIRYRNDPNYRCLGASGAISAVLFSYILYRPLTKIYLMFIPIGIPAYIFAVLYLVYSFYASRGRYNNINHEAHIYGAITGIVLTIAFDPGIVNEFMKNFG